MNLAYGMTEEELVLENLSIDLFNERGLRPRRLLDHLVELEGLPGSQARVLTMAMKLFRKLVDQAADGSGGYQVVRMAQNQDLLMLACLHTALIWECG